MATTSTSVADTTVHFRLSNISKNLTFGKIAKELEPRAISDRGYRSPNLRQRTGAMQDAASELPITHVLGR